MSRIIVILVIILMTYHTELYAQGKKADAEKKEGTFDVEYDDKEKSSDKASRDGKKSHTIIISADRAEKDVTDIPLASSVVDSEKIEEKVFTTMADLLSETPGFSQVYDYHSPLILRGMTGNKMLMLKNGNPRFSSFPGGFMGQNVNIYDLDRIEVIRGPASVIYGSGAMAGIINIIEKDVFDGEGLSVNAGGAYGTNGHMGMGIARVHWVGDTFAVSASGRFRKSENMLYGGFDEALNSHHQDGDAAFKTGVRFNKNHQLVLSGSFHFGGPWGKPYGFNKKEQMLAENDNDDVYHVALEYTGRNMGILEKLVFSGFYDYETRDYHKKKMNSTLTEINFDEITHYRDQYGGGYGFGAIEIENHTISLGFNAYIFRIWSPSKTVDYYNYATPTVTDRDDGAQAAGTWSIGTFIQEDWQVIDNLHIIAGIRYDFASVTEGKPGNHTEDRHAVSGNLGTVFKPTKTSSITFNVGRAFRMPDSMDMFTERATCAGTLYPNPSLDPEYSLNFDLGYRGRYKGLNWDLALFMNFYNNLIVKVPYPSDPSADMKANEEKARIMGGEAAISYNIKDFIKPGMYLKPGVSTAFYFAYSFTDGGNMWIPWETGKALSGIPPINIRGFVRYTFMIEKLTTFLEVEAESSLKKFRLPPEESEAPWNNEDTGSHVLINVTAGVKLYDMIGLEEIKLNVNVRNLLNTVYYPFGSHIPGKGLDVKMFLSFQY